MCSLKGTGEISGYGLSHNRKGVFLILLAIAFTVIVHALGVKSEQGSIAKSPLQPSFVQANSNTHSAEVFADTQVWSSLITPLSFSTSSIPAIQSNGAKLYVSRSGSNHNSGSLTAPWRTILYALSRARAGDTVFVRGGIYNENIKFPRSGAEGAPITLAAYPGERVILDGTGLPERDCFTITTQSYVTIDGFVVRNYSVGGTRGFGFVQWNDVAVTGITLRNLEIYNVGIPIKVAASGGTAVRSDITIENINAHDYPGGGLDLGPGPVANVTIRNVQLYGVMAGNDTGSDGIGVENGSHILIEDTIVRGHMGDGVDCKADGVTLRRVDVRNYARNGIKIWKGNALIESCWVSGSRIGLGALILGGSGAYVVRDSVILNTAGESGTMHSYSIEAGVEGPAGDKPTLVTLIGNTFHTDGNDGVLINLYNNARLQPDSDYNTYYSPRQDTIFSGARNASGTTMALVTPRDINGGVWARFVHGERHSKFSPKIPVKPDPALTSTATPTLNARPLAAPPAQRPRRVGPP